MDKEQRFASAQELAEALAAAAEGGLDRELAERSRALLTELPWKA